MGQPQYYHWDKIQKDTVYNNTKIHTFDTYSELIEHIKNLAAGANPSNIQVPTSSKISRQVTPLRTKVDRQCQTEDLNLTGSSFKLRS